MLHLEGGKGRQFCYDPNEIVNFNYIKVSLRGRW